MQDSWYLRDFLNLLTAVLTKSTVPLAAYPSRTVGMYSWLSVPNSRFSINAVLPTPTSPTSTMLNSIGFPILLILIKLFDTSFRRINALELIVVSKYIHHPSCKLFDSAVCQNGDLSDMNVDMTMMVIQLLVCRVHLDPSARSNAHLCWLSCIVQQKCRCFLGSKQTADSFRSEMV